MFEIKNLKYFFEKLIDCTKSLNVSQLNRKLQENENSITIDSYTENQKQLLLNCIRLINHGRYMASSENSTNQSPNMSRSRSVMEIPNINVRIFHM